MDINEVKEKILELQDRAQSIWIDVYSLTNEVGIFFDEDIFIDAHIKELTINLYDNLGMIVDELNDIPESV